MYRGKVKSTTNVNAAIYCRWLRRWSIGDAKECLQHATVCVDISTLIPSGQNFRSCNGVFTRFHGHDRRVARCATMMMMITLMIEPRRQFFDPAKSSPGPLNTAGAGLSTKSVDPQQLLCWGISQQVEFLQRFQ